MEYRKATFADVEGIFDLITLYAEQGVMLARSRNTLYENLRDLMVALDGDKVVGVGGLHIIWESLAEVRSTAVDPNYARHGIGGEIVRLLLEEGRSLGVQKFFTLTYQTEFFGSLGFKIITKNELPHKVWKDCIECPKFPNCDEIAMVKNESGDKVLDEVEWK